MFVTPCMKWFDRISRRPANIQNNRKRLHFLQIYNNIRQLIAPLIRSSKNDHFW